MLNRLLLAAGIAVFILFQAAAAVATPPQTFSFVLKDSATEPQGSLDSAISITLSGDEALDLSKLTVLIDGSTLVKPRLVDGRTIALDFVRNDQNAADWARLLRSPLFRDRIEQLPIFVKYGDAALTRTPAGPPGQPTQIELETYNLRAMLAGAALVGLIIVVGVLVAQKSWMVRDKLVPQLPFSQSSYSLGRIQMLLWTDVIVAAFVFLFVIAWGIPSISETAVTLMGISGATGLAAVGVDVARDSKATKVSEALTAMGLPMQSAVELLLVQAATNGSAKARPAIPLAKTSGASGVAASDDPTFDELKADYDKVTEDFRSAGFLKDLVNDANGPTLHRWQIIIWTLITAGVFVFLTHKSIAMPDLPTPLLTLMGVSGALYVGFKFPEKTG